MLLYGNKRQIYNIGPIFNTHCGKIDREFLKM